MSTFRKYLNMINETEENSNVIDQIKSFIVSGDNFAYVITGKDGLNFSVSDLKRILQNRSLYITKHTDTVRTALARTENVTVINFGALSSDDVNFLKSAKKTDGKILFVTNGKDYPALRQRWTVIK